MNLLILFQINWIGEQILEFNQKFLLKYLFITAHKVIKWKIFTLNLTNEIGTNFNETSVAEVGARNHTASGTGG